MADNFDANISSQNGLRSTHALALLLTQNRISEDRTEQDKHTISRIGKNDVSAQMAPSVPVQHYHGTKKPDMPADCSKRSILPLKILAERVLVRKRAQETDLKFMKDVTSLPETPEFGGYNTALTRNQGHR